MEKDIILKEYEQDPVHFCDLINGIFAEGRTLINPMQLQPMPTEVTLIRKMKNESGEKVIKSVQRFRDLTRKVLSSDGTGYVIIAIQNQAKVDHGMPIRVMTEDALEYDAQRRQLKDGQLHRDEKLMGVFTVTLYHGPDEWTGPKELQELIWLPKEFQKLGQYLQNYHMIFVSPQTVKPENFRTGWREVFEILKIQRKKKKMKEYLETHRDQLQLLPEDTNRLIFVLTDQLEYYEKVIEKGEKPDMCQAFEDYKEEGRVEGALETEKKIVTKMFKDGMNLKQVLSYVTILTRENLQDIYAATVQKA